MRSEIGRTHNSVTTLHRDDHDVSGKYYVHTKFLDDHALDKTKTLRNSGLMDKSELSIHDKADVRYAFSCPDVFQWNLFKKSNPDIYRMFTSKNEYERLRGAKQLSILHPEWLVHERA